EVAVTQVLVPRELVAAIIHKAALGHAQLARLCPRCAAARAVPPFGMKVVLPPRLTFLFIKEFRVALSPPPNTTTPTETRLTRAEYRRSRPLRLRAGSRQSLATAAVSGRTGR